MPTAGRILWIDNDRAYLLPFQTALEAEGYQVTMVETVSEAANLLTDGNYDLAILDVMIPMIAKDEEEGYGPEFTSQGQ